MTKVLLVGDTHSDGSFTANVLKAAKGNDVEVVIQLGDFGYSFDKNMIASINAWLDRDPNHLFYWIDGNHDQHDFLDEVRGDSSVPVSLGLASHAYHNLPFHERLFYVPRGAVFEVGHKTVMGLGGAYSIDKQYRRAHTSWWPQELITGVDADRAIKNADEWKVDVMITHDGPNSDFLEQWLAEYGYKVDPASHANRSLLGYVVNQVQPDELFHGHYHQRYTTTYETPEGWKVQVEGVGANVNKRGMIDSTAVWGENYLIREW